MRNARPIALAAPRNVSSVTDGIAGSKKPIQLAVAGFHPSGRLAFGDPLLVHRGGELLVDRFLDGMIFSTPWLARKSSNVSSLTWPLRFGVIMSPPSCVSWPDRCRPAVVFWVFFDEDDAAGSCNRRTCIAVKSRNAGPRGLYVYYTYRRPRVVKKLTITVDDEITKGCTASSDGGGSAAS
jgi:hypothetical protein